MKISDDSQIVEAVTFLCISACIMTAITVAIYCVMTSQF